MVNRNLLKGIIVANGYTQTQIAERMKLSKSAFSKKMNGIVPFTVDEAMNLADILSITDVNPVFFAKEVPCQGTSEAIMG
ncbi:MAG: helix-turn-helix transcriptional regulator [Anaerolineaceae bacterium]|nr:helix-turn-helix transcriptional regulator [Anaerolineaceae bacterium]